MLGIELFFFLLKKNGLGGLYYGNGPAVLRSFYYGTFQNIMEYYGIYYGILQNFPGQIALTEEFFPDITALYGCYRCGQGIYYEILRNIMEYYRMAITELLKNIAMHNIKPPVSNLSLYTQFLACMTACLTA